MEVAQALFGESGGETKKDHDKNAAVPDSGEFHFVDSESKRRQTIEAKSDIASVICSTETSLMDTAKMLAADTKEDINNCWRFLFHEFVHD